MNIFSVRKYFDLFDFCHVMNHVIHYVMNDMMVLGALQKSREGLVNVDCRSAASTKKDTHMLILEDFLV